MNKYVKFLLMLLGTCLVGTTAAVIGGLILGFAMRDTLFGFGGWAGGVAGLLIGYPVGVIIGVIVFRKVFKYEGSIWLGIGGAVAGALVPLGIAAITKLDVSTMLFFILVLALSPLAGTGGFFLGKKDKKRKRP